MADIWNWLSGKKTIIGVLLNAFLQINEGNGYFQLTPDMLGWLNGIADSFLYGGVAHKIDKATKK